MMAAEPRNNDPPPQQGDEDELFRRYQPRMLRILRAQIRTSPAVIEDACSFAWVQFLRNQPEREHAFKWLMTTAERAAIHLDRRAQRDVSIQQLAADEAETAAGERTGTRNDSAERLAFREALGDAERAKLTAREARAIGLYAAGYNYQEIAHITGWSRRTVERQLLRARAKLAAARDPEREARRARGLYGREPLQRPDTAGIDF